VEIVSVTMHEEVSKEVVAVKTFGVLKRQYGDRHLAITRRLQQKKRVQGGGDSRKKLFAACRGMIRHAIPTPQGSRPSGTRQGQFCKRSP
jgi:hypothetical protein